MYDSIDRRCGRHGVFEDLIPLREDQVRRDHHALALIPLREQRKEHLHLGSIVLDVPDVIERDTVKVIESLELRASRRFFFASSSRSTICTTVVNNTGFPASTSHPAH